MTGGRLRRYTFFAYGLFAYLFGLATIAYAVGFVANAVVPKTIDAGAMHSLGDPLLVNLGLIGLFGLQHSLMARPAFKATWTRLVPEPIERSTYVLFASGALALLMWGWRPLPSTVWEVEGALAVVLWGVYLGGWALMFAGVVTIDMNDLLGLRQVWAYLRGRDLVPLEFQTPGLYRYVRHPIMTGFLVAFWATPRLSVGHVLFAGGTTAYILLGTTLEERDLLATFGERYEAYRAGVPRFVPRPRRSFEPSPSALDEANVDNG